MATILSRTLKFATKFINKCILVRLKCDQVLEPVYFFFCGGIFCTNARFLKSLVLEDSGTAVTAVQGERQMPQGWTSRWEMAILKSYSLKLGLILWVLKKPQRGAVCAVVIWEAKTCQMCAGNSREWSFCFHCWVRVKVSQGSICLY